jgi:hypothetical protein
LASTFLRLLEIVDLEPDEEACAVCLFETMMELLPPTEFPLLSRQDWKDRVT